MVATAFSRLCTSCKKRFAYKQTDAIFDENGYGYSKYTVYDKHVQVRKEINSIYLPREKELNTYEAAFTQSMLLDKYSIGKADKDKCAFPITAYILEKFKEWKKGVYCI